MSLIHLVLLAKAVEEQKKKTGAIQSNPKKQESKKNNSYESSLNSYYNNSSSMDNFLEALLATDPEATKLFLLLEEAQKQIDTEDHQKSLEKVQEISAKYDEQDRILQSKKTELKAMGITLDESLVIRKHYCSVKVKEGKGFGNYGSYSYNPARYLMGFNGIPLTKEMIENNTNQFQIDLNKLNEENPELDNRLSEITKKIEKLKKSLKYNPFNKTQKQ